MELALSPGVCGALFLGNVDGSEVWTHWVYLSYSPVPGSYNQKALCHILVYVKHKTNCTGIMLKHFGIHASLLVKYKNNFWKYFLPLSVEKQNLICKWMYFDIFWAYIRMVVNRIGCEVRSGLTLITLQRLSFVYIVLFVWIRFLQKILSLKQPLLPD